MKKMENIETAQGSHRPTDLAGPEEQRRSAAAYETVKESPEMSPEMSKRAAIRKTIFLWVRDIAIAVAIALIVMQFIKPTIVQQSSMENTLHQSDYIFLNRQAYTFGDHHRGDIIVFHSQLERAEGGTKNLIKRIVGLPGDRIRIRDGNVLLNGRPLEESYTKDGFTAGEMEEVTVPKDHLFVLGDNRQNSEDSRSGAVGFVSEKQVVGKAFFRLFPFNKIGTLH